MSAADTNVSARALALRLRRLIHDHSSRIGALLERLGVARADVDDVKQRIWLTALRWHERVEPGRERAFLFAVARREAGHLRRSYRRRAEVCDLDLDSLEGAAPAADELLNRRERRAQAEALLGALTTELREVFVPLESGESSSSELARALGIPIGTAKSRWRRARRECARHVRRARCE